MAEMEKDFYVESAFGEVYRGTFFDEEVRNISSRRDNGDKSVEVEAAAPIRMFNEVDVARESTQAVNAAYKLNGDFNGIFTNYFSGKIFGNI